MNNQGWFIQNGGLFDPAVFTNSGSFVLNSGTNMDGVFLNDFLRAWFYGERRRARSKRSDG